jgi:hypothetical protein
MNDQQGPQPEPSQLDALKFRILAVPWWINFILGFIGAVITAPFGQVVGMPWYVAAALGFVLGYTLLHYLHGLMMGIFTMIVLWAAWFVMAHYDPHQAADMERDWGRFRNAIHSSPAGR